MTPHKAEKKNRRDDQYKYLREQASFESIILWD